MIKKTTAVVQRFGVSLFGASDSDLVRKRLAYTELVLITFGFSLIVWEVGPNLAYNGLAPLLKIALLWTLIYIVFISPVLIHKDTLAERGFGSWNTCFIRLDNLGAAFTAYVKLAIFSATVILLLTALLKPEAFSNIVWESVWLKFALNLLNALGQGLLFLSFFMLRLKQLFPVNYADHSSQQAAERNNRVVISLLCGTLFAFYHLPNPPLMVISYLFGIAVSWVYYERPNILPVILLHALLGTLLHRVTEIHMRIGAFYWQSDRWVFRDLFPSLKDFIGGLF